MSKKKRILKDIENTFGPQYDSDKDLTDAERSKIRNSSNPSKTREKTWEKKGVWDKTKKMLKSGWYGDKQKKKKY